MWITVYAGGMKCYTIVCKWEKVERVFSTARFTIKNHERMKIVERIYKVMSVTGVTHIKVTHIKGLRVRKLVRVRVALKK